MVRVPLDRRWTSATNGIVSDVTSSAKGPASLSHQETRRIHVFPLCANSLPLVGKKKRMRHLGRNGATDLPVATWNSAKE
jgi:hypothetical protein